MNKKADLDDTLRFLVPVLGLLGGAFGFYLVNSSYNFVDVNFSLPDNMIIFTNIILGTFFALWVGIVTLKKARDMKGA